MRKETIITVILLPYPDKPIFQCYHDKAFQVGIIQGNSPKDITKWVCTKYINCAFAPQSPMNKFIIMVSDDWGEGEHLVTHQYFRIKKSCLHPFNMDLLHILKTAIRNNCYIYGSYNERYIPDTWGYNHSDFMHNFLLMGCDRDKFIATGYVADGRFRKFEIPNNNMLDGLFAICGAEIELHMYCYEQGAIPTPHIKNMLEDLSKYISPTYYLENPVSDGESRGIATNICLKEFFADEVAQGKHYIDRRYSRVLYEHKWVLAQLVDQFLEEDSEKKKHQEWANKNLQRAQLVHTLGLKMSYTKDASIITRVTDLMDQIIEDETQNIPALLDLLQNKYSKFLV